MDKGKKVMTTGEVYEEDRAKKRKAHKNHVGLRLLQPDVRHRALYEQMYPTPRPPVKNPITPHFDIEQRELYHRLYPTPQQRALYEQLYSTPYLPNDNPVSWHPNIE